MDDKAQRGRGPGSDGTVREDFRVTGAPESGSLTRLLTFYPFLRLFAAVAHRQFPSSLRPETRVARLRANHPRFYGLCVLMDFLVVLIGAALVLATPVVALSNVLG